MARIALYDASGPLTDLLQKLSGDEGDMWLRNFKRFLRGDINDNGEIDKREFATWRKLAVGKYKSIESMIQVLVCTGFMISLPAQDLLESVKVVDSAGEIELVRVSLKQLGFVSSVSFTMIRLRAAEFGLDLLPAEVGPHLRLEYPDQQNGESINIGMEPLIMPVEGLSIFQVAREGGIPLLRTTPSDRIWTPEKRWVFARRKQNK